MERFYGSDISGYTDDTQQFYSTNITLLDKRWVKRTEDYESEDDT